MLLKLSHKVKGLISGPTQASVFYEVLLTFQKTSKTHLGLDQSFKEFAVRLVGFLRHWLEREEIGNDFAKFADLVAREQLMVSCSKEVWQSRKCF
jgi:hypothetical protein